MAGRKQKKMGVVLGACLALLFHISSAGTSHTVGDTTGWTIPSSSSFYSSWASKHTFTVGDFLVFNFQSGMHTVAEVSKSAYDSCAIANPIAQVNTGPANLTISSASTHYYICTINGHCSAGQKLAITATTSAASPPSSTAPAPKSTPTPSAAPTPTAAPTPSPAVAPTPKSTTTPAAAPAPSPQSSTAPSPTPSPTPASTPAPGPSTAPVAAPETAPTPSASGPAPPSPSPIARGPAAGGSSTTPKTPSPAEQPTGSTPTPPSLATVANAGFVLPLLVIIGANFLY